MFTNLDVFATSMAMARHAGQKQALSAENIANSDTPGYQARELPDFASAVSSRMMEARATRDTHLFGRDEAVMQATTRREAADPNGNAVSVELEMIEAVAAKRQHDRATAIYRHAMTMLRSSISTR